MRHLAELVSRMRANKLHDERSAFEVAATRHELLQAVDGEQPEFRQHPLGFLVADLKSFDLTPEERLRLHIWPLDIDERSDGRGSRHTHSWDLRSAVVSGSIRNDIFSTTAGGDTKMGRIDYHSDGTSVTVVGDVDVTLIRSEVFSPGDIYTAPGSEIHQSVLDDGPAATLVLARERGLPVFMLLDNDSPSNDKTKRPVLSPAEVTPLLAQALT